MGRSGIGGIEKLVGLTISNSSSSATNDILKNKTHLTSVIKNCHVTLWSNVFPTLIFQCFLTLFPILVKI